MRQNPLYTLTMWFTTSSVMYCLTKSIKHFMVQIIIYRPLLTIILLKLNFDLFQQNILSNISHNTEKEFTQLKSKLRYVCHKCNKIKVPYKYQHIVANLANRFYNKKVVFCHLLCHNLEMWKFLVILVVIKLYVRIDILLEKENLFLWHFKKENEIDTA